MVDPLQSNLAPNQVPWFWLQMKVFVPKQLLMLPCRENTFLTGSMVRPRRMEVWSSAGNNLTMVATLSGDEMASVASLVDVHPGVNICPKDLLIGSSVAVLTWLFNSFFAGRCCWGKLLRQAPSVCIISQHMDRNLL